ncbi:MAG: heme ABC exporter ATP-binding protein CcmA [Rhodospirillales bacterium]
MTDFAGRELICVRGGRTVFEGLAFRVEGGGALVLGGPNGSGKSSLLRLMAGLARPSAGVMLWNGANVAEDPAGHRARVHYVGHSDATKPALTVAENLGFWAAMTGGADGAEPRAIAALDAFGIRALADVPGRYLSAGQRRRLGLARLVCASAPLWLLDEPKTALDSDAARRLDALVAHHRAAGGMVVMSMHGGRPPEGAAQLDLAHFQGRAEAAPC